MTWWCCLAVWPDHEASWGMNEHPICSSKWTLAYSCVFLEVLTCPTVFDRLQTPLDTVWHWKFPVVTKHKIIVCSCYLRCLPGFLPFLPLPTLWIPVANLSAAGPKGVHGIDTLKMVWWSLESLVLLIASHSAFDQPGSHTPCKRFTLFNHIVNHLSLANGSFAV